MKKQPDFANEETLLQYHARILGCGLRCSPKCHPEIAGEGIEFMWGLAKVEYRIQPIENKKSKETFRDLVRQCIDSDNVLTLTRARKCAKRQRDYMIAYKAIKNYELSNLNIIGGNNTRENNTDLNLDEVCFKNIVVTYGSLVEKVMKK